MGLLEDVRAAVKRSGRVRFCTHHGIDVDDVVQDVIERSLRRQKTATTGTTFKLKQRERYWLNAVEWMITDHARRAKWGVALIDEPTSSIPNPEEIAIAKQPDPDYARVYAYASADPMLRAVVAGSHYAQVARAAGVHPSTVTRRVKKAQRVLGSAQKYGGSSVY